MKSMFKNFVNAYKVILALKKEYPVKKNSSFIIKQTLSFSIILITVFIAVGYIFQLLDSFNYTFLALHISVVAIYIIWLISKNKHEQYHMEQTYNILPVLIVEGSQLLAQILLFNVLIYAVYLTHVGSMIIFSLLIFLSLIVSGIRLIVSIQDHNAKAMRNVLKNSLVLFLTQLAIITILGVKSVPLNYTLSLLMTLTLYFLLQLGKNFQYRVLYYTSSIIMSALMTASLTQYYMIESFNLFTFELYESQTITIDYITEQDGVIVDFNPHNVFTNEDYILYRKSIVIEGQVRDVILLVYDWAGNLIKKVDYPDYFYMTLKSNQGFYIQRNFCTNCDLDELRDVDEPDKRYNHVYKLNENLEFEFFFEVEGEQTLEYIYETEDGAIIFYDGLIGHYDQVTKSLEWQHFTEIENFHFQTKTHYFFVEDGVAYSSFAHYISTNVLSILPFWFNRIVAYYDGYVISYEGDIQERQYVLINLETKAIKPLNGLLGRVHWHFIFIDSYLVYVSYLEPLYAYHLDDMREVVGERDGFYIVQDMSFSVRSHLIDNQIIIQTNDYDQGVRIIMRSHDIEYEWVIPVIVVVLMTFIYCKQKVKTFGNVDETSLFKDYRA
jgi:hypothetical protein